MLGSLSRRTRTVHRILPHDADHSWYVLQRLTDTVSSLEVVACPRPALRDGRALWLGSDAPGLWLGRDRATDPSDHHFRPHRCQHHLRQGRARVALQVRRRRVRRTRGLGVAQSGGRTAPVVPPDAQGPTKRGGHARDVRRLPRLQDRGQCQPCADHDAWKAPTTRRSRSSSQARPSRHPAVETQEPCRPFETRDFTIVWPAPARSPNGLLDRRQAEEPQDQEPKHGLAHRVEGHEIPLCDLRVPRASAELLHLLAEEEEW